MAMTTGSRENGPPAVPARLADVVAALVARYPQADAAEVDRLVHRVHAALVADPRVTSDLVELTEMRADEYLRQWQTRHYGPATQDPRSGRFLMVFAVLGLVVGAALIASIYLFG